MRKYIWLSAIIAAALGIFIAQHATAQISNPTITPVASAPSGSCSATLPLQLKTPDGTLYSCQNGVWAPSGAAGATGVLQIFPPTWNGTGAATNFLVANHTSYWGPITVSTWLSVGHILYYIPTTADNTANLYDLALVRYPAASTGGTVSRVLNIGPLAGTVFSPGTGLRDQPVQGGPVVIPPGTYLFAATTNCAASCAVLGSAGSITSDNYLTIGVSGPASTGGAVPASFSVGAWTISSASTMPGFMLEP